MKSEHDSDSPTTVEEGCPNPYNQFKASVVCQHHLNCDVNVFLLDKKKMICDDCVSRLSMKVDSENSEEINEKMIQDHAEFVESHLE